MSAFHASMPQSKQRRLLNLSTLTYKYLILENEDLILKLFSVNAMFVTNRIFPHVLLLLDVITSMHA
jgi:hypothetical protein